MKRFFFIVFLVGMAGCTSPQGPMSSILPKITGLNVPDTIDFGAVRAGLSKTLSVTFQNTGSDSIHITSQTISDSFFQEDQSWKQFSIAPDSSRIPNMTYIPHDSMDLAYDTLRSGNGLNIITLLGRKIPFSSTGFLTAPTEISISLTGVIGQSGNGPYTYSFYYDEPSDLSNFHDSVYSFDGSTSWVNDPSRIREGSSSSTNISATIDTNLIIKLLSVAYNYSYSEFGGPNFTKTEALTLHDIPLTKNGESFTATILGSSIKSLIDTVYMEGEYPYGGNAGPPQGMDNNQPPTDSLIGFPNSAKLLITIQ